MLVVLATQGRGVQEESCGEDRGAADEAGGTGHRSGGEQADRPGYLQAQLPGPTYLSSLVRRRFHMLCSKMPLVCFGILFLFILSSSRCKKFGILIEKIYNKTQREKFAWAIDMAEKDFEF